MKLNGWIRIGIILSVVWFLGASFCAPNPSIESRQFLATEAWEPCFEHAEATQDKVAWAACENMMTEHVNLEISTARWNILLYGFAPLPVFWLLSFIGIGTFKWVKRGF